MKNPQFFPTFFCLVAKTLRIRHLSKRELLARVMLPLPGTTIFSRYSGKHNQMPKWNFRAPSLTAKRAILESKTNTAGNHLAASGEARRSLIPGLGASTGDKPMIAPKGKEPVQEPPKPVAPAAEQPGGALHENHPEETSGSNESIPGEFNPGRLFAWFELQRELEVRSTGVVWLAHDYSVGRHVEQIALKFLPDFIVSAKAVLEALKENIRRRIALKHPNFLRVYDLVENKGKVAIQMEYLDGQSLASFRLTRPNQVFEVRDLEKWVRDLCQALEYAHNEAGIIDGAISPDNLILDLAGNLKLKDFGISQCIADSMSRLMVVHDPVETLTYKSPQRVAGQERAITDDLYSLGATIYELLTGKPPFFAGDIGIQVSVKTPPSMTERRAELGIRGEVIPGNWEETVAACLAKEPVQRPQSAVEVEKRLRSAISSPDDSAKTRVELASDSVAEPQPPVQTPTRMPWLAIAGILFILATGSVIAFFSFHRPTEAKLQRGPQLFPVKEPSPTPAVPPPPPGSTGQDSSLPVATPSPETSPTPSPEASPSPSPEVGLTLSPEVSSTPSPQEAVNRDAGQPTGPSPTFDATREAVIKRINALPGVTAERKANLIEKMQKARSMERLIVIPFDSGQTSLRRAAKDDLVKAFARPEMREKLNDPTMVLVVAGYADNGGRADQNLHVSQERAENVSRILKEQVKLYNAMQTIGMGGTELLDSKRPEQNRAVEVWAVVPL
jgi:serine/threonine protein kinase